ncbi:chorismate synthase [Ornithinimicrobium faecis]|uniref:chorismate synthase n=1 Tax=Ornithinimicrobium faecis TaxID=2934158 RepID=UPI002118DD4A|nr:chorismate synthase [Ornithinimicrobium sp. HY1745]
MLRWLTAGESHGPALTALLEGLPAGVRVERSAVEGALARRRLGYGRGARMSFEADQLSFQGGMRHGLTLGSPIALQIANSEWGKWTAVMNPEPVDRTDLERASDVGAPQEIARNKALTRPRPGHADLVGMQKYGFDEARPVLERASARETAARVALGAVAAAFLEQAAGIRLVSHTVAIGSVPKVAGDIDAPVSASLPRPDDVEAIDADPVRTLDGELSAAMVAEIDAAKKDGDTLGGVVEVLAWGVPPGLGSYTHWDRRLDSRLAGALMGIQAIKGVELGEGFRTAARRGSQAHDEILRDDSGAIQRQTLRSGGTEGGMSTGEVLRVRAAMKPISTVPRALQTIDVATGEPATAIHQRSDVCAVPAAGVVAEAMVALVLADAVLEKFGGDSVAEVRRNVESYLAAIPRLMGGRASVVDDLHAQESHAPESHAQESDVQEGHAQESDS